MIERTAPPLTRRVLIVDDELANPTPRAVAPCAAWRRSSAPAASRSSRPSPAKTAATVVSDSAIHCVLRQLDPRQATIASPTTEATELLRALRARNAKVPVFLMADRKVAGTVTVEVATLADEFVWMLEDTAAFIAGPRGGLDRALRPGPAAAVRRGAGPLRPRPGVLVGGARPPGRRRVPQVAGRPGVLRLLRREPVPHRHGDRARRARLAAGPQRPDRRERAVRGARVRRPPLLLGPERDVGLEPGHHVGLRGRRRDRALRPQLPQVDRAGPGPHRRDSGLPEPHPQPLRHHRADPAGAARARGDREDDRRRTRWPRRAASQAPGLRGGHELHLRRHVLRRRRTPRTGWRRASTASTSTRRGTATPGSTRCTATATRCGAIRPIIRRTAPPSSRRTRPTSCSRRSRRPRTSTSATAGAPSTTAASTRPTARRPAPRRSTRSSRRTRSRRR